MRRSGRDALRGGTVYIAWGCAGVPCCTRRGGAFGPREEHPLKCERGGRGSPRQGPREGWAPVGEHAGCVWGMATESSVLLLRLNPWC